MKISALGVDFFREIRKTFPRFLSILMISLLGVAFFSGIRSAEPDIRYTGDAYMDRHNLTDIRVVSTMGLDDDDLNALRQVEGVKGVEGGYSLDFINRIGDQSRVVHVFSIMDNFNKVDVIEGDMPKGEAECLLDVDYAKKYDLHLYDEVELDGGGDRSLKNNKLKVAGFCSSPEFITFSRGASTKGTGEAEGFVVVLPSAFDLEAYTKAEIKIDGDYVAFTKTYDDACDKVVKNIESIEESRSEARYQKIKDNAQVELDKAQSDFDLKKEEANKKLDVAKAELERFQTQLDKSKDEMALFKDSFNRNQAVYQAAEQGYQEAKALIAQNKDGLKVAQDKYNEGQKVLQNLNVSLERAYEAIKKYEQAHIPIPQEILNQKVQLENEIGALKGELGASKQKLNLANEQIQDAQQTLEQKRDELDKAKAQLDAAQASIDGGEVQIARGQQQLKSYKTEYERREQEVKTQFSDAQKQIDNKQRQIDDITRPKWYVRDRNGALAGYDEYGQNADRIKAIGEVFPIIFFLVAILICLTTITRMVDEQKTQIGTLKALGYTGFRISLKYVCYALFATIIGAVVGALIGGKVIPFVILKAYKIMYANLPDIVMPYNYWYGLLAMATAVICNLSAAVWACYGNMKRMPASLMRPDTPKSGKKILIERLKPLWRKLSFSHKATFRNLSRYKKRLFMTVLGISGCMSLIIVGFGLKDSISDILWLQFEKIQNYDEAVVFDPNAVSEDVGNLKAAVISDDRVDKSTLIYSKSVKVEKAGNQNNQVNITVPQDNDSFSGIVHLKERNNDEILNLDDDSCFVTEKLAKLLGIKEGDMVEIEDGTSKAVVKVGKVVENYLHHYIYMSSGLYQKAFLKKCEFNVIDIKLKEGFNSKEVGQDFMKYKAAINVTYIDTLKKQVDNMLGSLNSVIAVLIISAGLLAFVVLYNLNNININERKRELASIKVLGFTDLETAGYIYRENVYLTIIGIVLGMALGFLLHKYVVTTVEIDTCMFSYIIRLPSYIYSILLTVLFSVFVNFFMYFKLKKIDMAGSLKSVE